MNIRRIRCQMVKISVVLLLTVSASCIPAMVSHAAEGQKGIPTVNAIPPVPSFNHPTIDIQGSVAKAFNGRGRIDKIYSDSVIIDDIGRKFSDSSAISGFQVGQYVAFKLDASGRITELKALAMPKPKGGR